MITSRLALPLAVSLALMGALSFLFCVVPPRLPSPSETVSLLGSKLTFISVVAALGFLQYGYFRPEAVKDIVEEWVPRFFTRALSFPFAMAAPVLLSSSADLVMLMYGSRPWLCSVSYAGLGAALLVFSWQAVQCFRGVRQELMDAAAKVRR